MEERKLFEYQQLRPQLIALRNTRRFFIRLFKLIKKTIVFEELW